MDAIAASALISRTVPTNLRVPENAAGPTEAPVPLDRNQAELVASTLEKRATRGNVTSRLVPALSTPTTAEPDAQALQGLYAALSADGAKPQAGPFMHAAIRTVGERELPSLSHPDAGQEPDAALQEAFKSLIGLQSSDGELVFPTVKAREALSGLLTPTTDGQEPLGTLLSDTPALREVVDEANAMNDEELSVRMNSDPRFAFVLMLVAFLMKLAASQREQAAGMLIYAEKSVHDMGERMVDSAKQQQLAKVVALVVVVVVSTVAVGVGATAANRNINSIKTNQRTANDLNAKANKSEVKLASGANDAPAGSAPMSFSQHAKLREPITRARDQAKVLEAEHVKTQTTASVVNQAGQTLGQASNAAGSAAGSGHEIEAAHLTALQEKRRADASAGQQINQAMSQSTTKVDESTQAFFRQAQQAEQEKADTRNAITSNIGR